MTPTRASERDLAPHLSLGTARVTAASAARLSRGTGGPRADEPALAPHLSPGTARPDRSARSIVVGLALLLSLGTAPAYAAPPPAGARDPAPGLSSGTAPPPASERDLAYEQGSRAEEAGDHAAAAAAYERAYRLTLPGETGPRLLFLRASVAARLRAEDGAPTARVQLCHAQSLLHDYLGETRGPATEEHAALGRVDQRLAAPGPDCAALLAAPAPTPPPEVRPTTPAPAAKPTPDPRPTAPAPARRSPQDRALVASGGVALGLGVAAFAVMGAGIRLARDADRRGRAECQADTTTCDAYNQTVLDIREDGALGNRLTRIGAVTGGLTVLVGVALLVVGERLRRRPVTPQPGPGELGLGLAARF